MSNIEVDADRMKLPKSMLFKVIQFAYRLNYKKLIQENIQANDNVLDVGSGLGFLKPLVISQGAFYQGFEPREYVYKAAQNLYGIKNFYNKALDKNHSNIFFNKIISITVLDEVDEKLGFIKNIKSYSNNDTKIILAVRNADFPFRRGVNVMSSFNNTVTKDLGYTEWIEFFNSVDLQILSVKKINRPLVTSLTSNGIKAAIIRFLDLFLNIKKNHMLCFILSVKEVDNI